MRDFIGYGLGEQGPNKNVINIIRVLVEDPKSRIFIPFSYAVERENKNNDPKVHFPPKVSGRPLEIVDVQGHNERFNLSVKCLAPVKVEVETEDGQIHLEDKKVWRNYNIIRDGELVIDHIVAQLSKQSFDDLRAAGGILYLGEDMEISDNFVYDENTYYSVKLTDIPLVSTNWARPNALKFHNMLLQVSGLTDCIKSAKKYLKENDMPLKSAKPDPSIYTEQCTYSSSGKLGKIVPCVTYEILGNPNTKAYSVNGMTTEKFEKYEKNLKDLKFRCFCIKWALETAHKKNSYSWSEVYQKRSGSSKYYQEAVVDIDSEAYRLQRCYFEKEI